MMTRLFKSFGHVATIWIPTMFAFSFAFQVILRDSGIEPWNSANQHQNASAVETIFVILQAFTKTSAMMLGEVEADTILGTRQWVPSILLLIFEITTVILLMNLMVSIAVGDVNDLRKESNSGCLSIKINLAINSLQLAEAIPIPFFSNIRAHSTNNVLVFNEDGDYYATLDEGLVDRVFDQSSDSTPSIVGNNENPPTDSVKHCPCCQGAPKKRTGWGRKRRTLSDLHGCTKVHGQDIGILMCKDIETEDYFHLQDETSILRKAKKWMIGLDWHTYVDMEQLISDATN
ncbi:hypothetical protein PRIPAC_89886 [Pristionchus pacificus]|nr:hypothetical protein PRIPAC_89886 [Pristionchus pacificus]